MEETQGLKIQAQSAVNGKAVREFTRGEERFNAITHIAGGAIGIAFLVIGIVFAALYKDAYAVVSMSVYGASMIILYSMSSIYHFLRPGRAKRLFRILDHCTIFALIAGTYTPFCLIALRQSAAWGWSLFGALWFLAAVGITFNAIDMNNKIVKVMSMAAYLVMGWCAVIVIVPLLKVLPLPGFLWILAGGIAYTVGAVFYACGRRAKYIHSVWHLLVVAGSVLQFFGILFYIVL